MASAKQKAGGRCYTAAGFQPVTPEQAAEWNTGQPVGYLWFTLAT